MSSNYDYLLKIFMLGGSSVGKQDFLLKFINEPFTKSHMTTLQIDFKIKIINLENKRIKLQIWDTGGEERFRTLLKTYYKGAQGLILMYDVSDPNTFKYIRDWMKQIEKHGNKSIKKILVGNNCDSPDRVISEEEGKKLADEFNLDYFESSTKTNKNVSEVFYYLAKEILKEQGIIKDEETIKLGNINGKRKKNGCDK